MVCFNCKSEYECDINPDATVIPRGGILQFEITVTNNIDEVQVFYFATKITMPNGRMYPPNSFLLGPWRVTLNHYDSQSIFKSHTVPGSAALGTYTYHGYVGRPGVGIHHECQFEFEITEVQ